MGQLSRQSRTALITALQGLPFTDTDEGRSLLVSGLPPGLRGIIRRSASQYADLSNMVDAAAGWYTASADDAPLLLLIDNAIGPVEGSQQGEDLKALRARIQQELVAPPIGLAAVQPAQWRAIAIGGGALGLILLIGLLALNGPFGPRNTPTPTPTVQSGLPPDPTPTPLLIFLTETPAPLTPSPLPLTATPGPPTATPGPPVWQPVLRGVNIRDLTGASGDSNTMYAGGDGVHRSTDGGQTWTTLTTDFVIDEVRVAPLNPQLLYGATTLGSAIGIPGGLYRSDDGGRSWQSQRQNIFPIDIDSTNSQHLFGLGAGGAFESKDGGATWGKLDTSDSHGYEGTFFVRGVNNRTQMYAVYESEGGGAFMQRSTNGGDLWQDLPMTETLELPRDLTVDPQDARHLYYLGGNGFFSSADGGMTWHAHNTGLDSARPTPPFYDVTSLARQPAGGAAEPLYLGTFAGEGKPGGIFRYNRTRDAWERVAPAPGGQSVQRLLVANGPAGLGLLAATPNGIYRWPLR